MESIIESWDAHNLDHSLDIAADALRLPPWDADVNSLSGGEKRRVAIARALMQKPDILLADEIVSELDHVTAREIMDLITNAQKKNESDCNHGTP